MQFRLYKMGIEGKVAVANMALINCALAVILYHVHIQSEGSRAAAEIASGAMIVLGFPVGGISLIGSSMHGPDVMFFTLLAIFLPLNAYVWGYTVAAIVSSHKARRARRLSGDQESPCP